MYPVLVDVQVVANLVETVVKGVVGFKLVVAAASRLRAGNIAPLALTEAVLAQC